MQESKNINIEQVVDLFKKYKEQISYLFFGGCTTLVNIVVYYLATRVFGIGILWSTTLGWVFSVTFAYVTNKIWVFESKTNGITGLLKEAFHFYLCRGATYFVDLAAMELFVEVFMLPDMLIKIIANVVIILLNYILSKVFIFRKEK